MGMCELSWVVQCSVLEKVLRLLRVDAVLQQSGAQIFKGKSVPLVLGALLRLGEHGAHLTVLQGVIGDVGDELLAGDGDQPQHARVVRRKAGAVHVMGRHRVGNGGLVVFEELQKVYQRLASGLLLLLLCWLRLLLMLLLLLLLINNTASVHWQAIQLADIWLHLIAAGSNFHVVGVHLSTEIVCSLATALTRSLSLERALAVWAKQQ